MNNLKRVLSLALTGAMLVGTMLVGASAANTGFSDQAEIKHTDAVNTLVALNVINGKDDGSYDPTGSLTRAEMAKLIVYALNGGKEPVMSTKATPTYTDIKGHWAEKYIEYCSNLGIIAGRGDGTFDPAGVLTGSQAAKMMLVAMNYKPDIFGFTGTDWEINVNGEANNAGLYEELLGMDPTATITRDQAAQLVYNGILANTMKLTWNQNTTTGAITQGYVLEGDPLFESKFNGQDDEGILTGFDYDGDKESWTYDISGMPSQSSKKDFTDLFGMNVRVLYSVSNGKITNYGVYAKDSSVLAEGYAGDIPATAASDTSVKVNGTTYKLDTTASATKVVDNNQWTNNVAVALTSLSGTDTGYSFKFIDNDADGKVDVVVKTPFIVEKVTYVGKDTITIPSLGNVKLETVDVYEGIAKNDVVVTVVGANTKTEKDTVTKANVLTATVDGTRAGEYRVDDEWYTNAANTININDKIDYVAFGSVLYYTKVVEDANTTKDLAMVITIGTSAVSSDIDNGKPQARLLMADGSKKTVDLDDGTYTGFSGKLVTYKLNNGKYTLTAVNVPAADGNSTSSGNLAGYETGLAAVTGDATTGLKLAGNKLVINAKDGSGTAGNSEVSDTAKVFLFKGTVGTANAGNDGKLYTGREIKSLGGLTTVGGAFGLTDTVNGFPYVMVATTNVASFPTVRSGANYGYLVSDAYHTYDAAEGKDYVHFTYWDGQQDVTAKAEMSDEAPFKAGAIITFDVVSDGVIKNVGVPASVTGYVTGWDGVKKIALSGTASNTEITSDTVVFYVNSSKTTGLPAEDNEISIADKPDGTNYVNNVRYIYTAGLDLLVVDVNNKIAAAPARVFANTATASDITTEFGTGALNVAIDGDWTTDGAITVPAKGTLTVNGDLTVDASKAITLSADAKLIVNGNLTANETQTVTDVTGTVTVAAGKTLTVNGTATLTSASFAGTRVSLAATADVKLSGTISDAESAKLAAVAGAKVTVVGTDVTASATTPAFYSKTGTATGETASTGTAAAQVTVSTAIPVGTYVYGTYGFSDNNKTAADAAGFFLLGANGTPVQ